MKPSTGIHGLSIIVTSSLIGIIFKYMVHLIPQSGPGHSLGLFWLLYSPQHSFGSFATWTTYILFHDPFNLFLRLSVRFWEFCGTLLLVSLFQTTCPCAIFSFFFQYVRVPILSDLQVPATELSVGLLVGRLEQQQKPLRVIGPLGIRLRSSLKYHPSWQWGRYGLKCPHSLMGPQEPHIWLTLYTWDLERDLLVYTSSQQTGIHQNFVASNFASQCDPSLTPHNILSHHTVQHHPDMVACNASDVRGMLTSFDCALW